MATRASSSKSMDLFEKLAKTLDRIRPRVSDPWQGRLEVICGLKSELSHSLRKNMEKHK